MKHPWVLIAALGIAVSPGDARSADEDPCDGIAGMASEARLELKGSDIDEAGAFVGTFEIENQSRQRSISVGLVGETGGDFAFRPDTSIEYLDLSSDWRRLLDLPGSYRSLPRMQVLQPGERYVFKAMLMSAETARQNAREFRVLLRTYNPRLCVFSVPFHGVPSRTPVLQLQSVGPRNP